MTAKASGSEKKVQKQRDAEAKRGKASGFAIATLVLGILALLGGWIPVVGWAMIAAALIAGIFGMRDVELRGGASSYMVYTGIALSIIGVVIAMLFFNWVLTTWDAARVLPNHCLFGQEFSCTDFTITTAGAGGDLWVNASLTNVLGTPITNITGTANATGYGNGSCTATPRTIPHNGAFRLDCDLKLHQGVSWPIAGRHTKVLVRMDYQDVGGFQQNITGEVFKNIR